MDLSFTNAKKELKRLEAKRAQGLRSFTLLFRMGRLYTALANYTAAEAVLREALEIAPSDTNTAVSLAEVMMAQRYFYQAYHLLLQIQKVCPSADVYALLGVCLLKLERAAESEKMFRTALKLDPMHLTANVYLANLLWDVSRYEEARCLLEKALQRDPDYAPALMMKAKILREENLPAESLPSLRKLMKSPQNYHAAALLYANACIDVGAFKEAQTVLMDLKDHKESQPKALYLLSLVGKLVEDAKFEDKLKQLLSRPDLVPQDKVDVFYAYSKYCDDTGRYGEAIEYAMAAKNMEKKHFDLSKYQSFVDAHIAAIDTDMFDKLYHENKSTTQFCFVVGMPRSGTTLAEQTIVKLDGAVSLGEQQYFRSVANQLGMNADFQGYLARLKSQTTSELFKIRENYESICRKAGDGNLYIDKMPHNYEVLPLIRLCFPDAKFVWCQRNPIDTCLSIFLHRFSDMHAYSATLKSLGAYYKEYERLMLHYQTIPALHAFGLEYERLVSDGGELRQALLDWLKPGAIYDENKTSTVRTFSRWQVRQPIYQSSVERWRRYESHIADLLTALHWPRDKS